MAVNRVSYARSYISTSDMITFEHTWTIKNINRLTSDQIDEQSVLNSAIFIAPPDKVTTTEDKKPVQFVLRFYPKGNTPERQNFASLFLKMNNGPSLNIMFVHSVVMANGEKHNLMTKIKTFDLTVTSSWGINSMPRDELYNAANGFVSADSLTIHCEVNIIVNELAKPDLCDQLQHKCHHSELVTKLLCDLLNSGAHSNVSLVLVHDGGQVLLAHKDILVARSRVFADMFDSKMAESETNRMEIVETRVEVFRQVLHFIYTGQTISLDGIAQDVLICADKYQQDSLKSICEEYLVASGMIITESNLSELLELANQHDASKLKAKVVETMRKKIEAQLQNEEKMMQMDRVLSNLATERTD